jgi:hypothetical protein
MLRGSLKKVSQPEILLRNAAREHIAKHNQTGGKTRNDEKRRVSECF